jgi:hypothetical protein
MMELTTAVSELFNLKTLAVLVERGNADEIVDCGDLGRFHKNVKIYRCNTVAKVKELALKLDAEHVTGMWFIPGVGHGNFGDGGMTEKDFDTIA